MGVRVGQHPLTPHRQALRNWQSFDGEHRETGEPLGRHAMGVAKMRRTNLDRKGSNVLVAGVLTRWEQSTGNHGASVRFDLEGSDGSWIEGVMWTKQLTRLLRHGGVPPLGSVVAVDGWATRRTIQVRAGSDGSDIDARDHDSIERVTEVEVLRLRADSIEVIDLRELKRVDLNPAPAQICIVDAAERGRHILAARNLSKRRRKKPAGLSARPATRLRRALRPRRPGLYLAGRAAPRRRLDRRARSPSRPLRPSLPAETTRPPGWCSSR